jgi:nanoRNase/pAp phosphatase (c-di-AMP/oligoRNAs hydrolase)
MLQLHKKVTLVCEDDIDKKYAFLPWFDKLRMVSPSGADYILKVENESLLSFFNQHEVKINTKIALALYAGLLQCSNNLQAKGLDGMFFAQMSQLSALGVDHNLCVENLFSSKALSLFRLKARMFELMQLTHNASVSCFSFNIEEILSATGASMQDIYLVMQESLSIVNVKKAILLDKNKIIKTIEEI